MSAEAMAHVFRCSPYPGTSKEHAVLLAVADTVSDLNDNRFWMGQTELARKARVSKERVGDALKQLSRDGWIVLRKDATPRTPAEYELVIVDREVEWEPRREREARRLREAKERGDAQAPVDAPSPGDAQGGGDAPSPGDGEGGGGRSVDPGGTHRPLRGDAASTEPKRTQGITQQKRSASPPVAASGDGSSDSDLLTVTGPDGQSKTVDLISDGNSFGLWWKLYPRQPGTNAIGGGGSNQKARARWRRMTPAQRRAAYDALPHYRQALRITGQTPCHASTWLNQQRWEDHADPPDASLGEVGRAVAVACGLDPDRLDGPMLVEVAQVAAGLPDGTTADAVGQVADAMAKAWDGDRSMITPRAMWRWWHRYATTVTGRTSGSLCGRCGQPREGHDEEVCEMLRSVA